jgi:hypothetical protein
MSFRFGAAAKKVLSYAAFALLSLQVLFPAYIGGNAKNQAAKDFPKS